MTAKILLDVRSGERNASSTGLCLRVVDESSSISLGRAGRDLYEIGGEGVGSYALIASGDGEIGLENVELSFTELGGDLWLTNSRIWLEEVRVEGELLDHYFGGTVVKSSEDLSGVVGQGVVGGLFWWTRNDSMRTRLRYENRGWELLKGGAGVVVGVVGGEEKIYVLGDTGELRIGGKNSGDINAVSVYTVGGLDFPVVEEGSGLMGLEGAVLSPSGEVLFKEGSSHVGKEVFYVSGSLNGGGGLVGTEGYLSPQPQLNEYPLLRVAGYGYSAIEFVATEGDLGEAEYGVVRVCLESGRILSSSPVIYDGLVLCDAPVGVGLGVGSVPLMSVPDGSGLEPSGEATSFRPTGVGLRWAYRWSRSYVRLVEAERTLPVELVDKLPKKLSVHRGYLVGGTTEVILSDAWSNQTRKLFGGHVRLERGGLRHMSTLSISGKAGVFSVDGGLVSFSGGVVSGSGVSLVGGHIVVDIGSVVDHPSSTEEFESLRSIGLVPSSSLETGLEFVLTRSSIKGYYSYDEEKVADISGSSAFQFLQFEPRVDFSGYEAGKFFKVGDKVLGEGDIESSFGSSPNGFHWIAQRNVSSSINEETSRLALGSGLRVGTTSLSITQERADGTVGTEGLVEGVGYDLPSDGLEGQARLINRLGSEVLSGQRQGSLNGLDLDLEKDLSGVRAGDLFYDGLNVFKITTVSGTVISLSSALGLQSGRWKIYRGYREGLEELETPDPTKVVGEVLDVLSAVERDPVEVYKIYKTLAFEKVLPSSKLFVRKVVSGQEVSYPLDVLRDEVLLSPYELSGDHYEAGSYRIKVAGVEYEAGVVVEGRGFSVVDDRVIFEKAGESDTTWLVGEVVFVRKPRSLADRAEMDLGENLVSPFTPSDSFDEFLELLASPRVEPTSGAISFEDPLEMGVGVEVSYTPSDDISSGRIIEIMGFNTVQEEATKVNDYEYRYNPTNKEVELLSTPTVFVGAEQIAPSLYSIDENTIRFSFLAGATVKVSYTTLSSNGGDATVRTSSGMVIPKYKISKGGTTLSVHRDLRGVLGAGDLIKVGTQVFNVVSVGESAIELNPPATVNFEGSSISFLNVPTFTYEGTTSSYAFRQITGAVVSSKPKSPDLFLQGDYRDFIKASSLLIVEGVPYRVKVVGLDGATGMTKASVEGFTLGHDFTSTNNLFVSFRPILEEGSRSLTLATGLVDTYEYQLVKYDHGIGRGRLLIEGADYKLNSEAGLIDLVNGHVVSPQVSYYLLHTALSGIKPFTLLGGRVSKPVYRAIFNQSRTPTELDGLGLNVSCVVSSPDTFQVRIADEEEYASEIANELQQSVNQDTGSGGKLVISSPTSQGKAIGIYDLLANDVVARSRINLYNGYIQPVDDIISTTTGKVVGEGDGSFKFNLLKAGDWIAPGLEDSITREIYPRYVSMEYLTPLNPSNPYPTPEDPILIGDEPPSAKTLASLLEKQKPLIENEMDDYVLIGQRESTAFDLTSGFPYIRMDYDPVYSPMWKRHRFSRLYPTSTRMFSYRNLGTLDSTTNGITIANVQNGSIGQIENITALSVVKRRPARFRVYGFSLNGYASVAETVGKPTFILSAVPLDEFPVDVSTGLPDTTQFVSEGGSVADVVVGNVDRVFNGLQVGGKVSLSREGEIYPVLDTSSRASLPDLGLFPPITQEAPRNAKVKAVVEGCYVVLQGSSFSLEVNRESLVENPPKRGDTIIESFARDLDDDRSPATTFRVGSDIGLKSSTGELIDISLPSASDPDWPLKEITGQNVPSSGLALEGDVNFLYGETVPFRFPALDGEAFDDSGDETIPYKTRFSERDLLPQIPSALNELKVQTTNSLSSLDEYAYPDEARGTADISSNKITTSQDFSLLSGECEQAPRQGDLVILKPDSGAVAGCASTGVLELGLIEGDEIYPPTYTTPGDIRYSIENMVTSITGNVNRGVFISESFVDDSANGVYDISKVSLTFNDLPSNLLTQIYTKIESDGEVIAFTLLDPITHAPKYGFNFIKVNGSPNWVAQLSDISGGGQVSTNGTLNVVGGSITFTEDPIPDPYDQSVDTLFDYGDMGSWLFENSLVSFWSNMNPIVSVPTLSLSSSLNGNDKLYFDYVISLYHIGGHNQRDVISNNRVDIQAVDTAFTSWVFETINDSIVSPLDYLTTVEITRTYLEVFEEGGLGTQTIISGVNNSTYRVSVVDDSTLRTLSLDGVDRANDPMSIFIGSEVDDSSTILQGSALNGLINPLGDTDLAKSYLRNVSPSHGSLDQVMGGDLLYIENGHNAGTHRVKGVVPLTTSTEYEGVLGSSVLLPVSFPKLLTVVDNGNGTATITTDSEDLSLYFASSGTLFILINESYTTRPESVSTNVYDQVYGLSQVHIEYDSLSSSSFIFTEDTSVDNENPHYADGESGGGVNHPTGLTIAQLITLIGDGGQTLAGITRIPFNTQALGLGLVPVDLGSDLEVSFSVGGGYVGSSSALTEVIRNDDDVVVAFEIPNDIYESVSDRPEGNEYHDTYISPNDTIRLTISVNSGIYLDPTFPRLLRDYTGTTPVEFSDGSSQVRSATDSTLSNLPAWDFSEMVNFTVRRLRRFTDVFSNLIYAFEGFRYLYEQRTGRVGSVSYASGVITLTPLKVDGEGVANLSGTDTQVGDFSHVVSVGDQVQCVNSSNQETLYLRVLGVGSTLQCSAIRGSVSEVSNGDVFRVITRVPLIPELQAFDQFIEHGFTEVYSTPPLLGISVEVDNELKDTNADFIQLGVSAGDYLVIDPQGDLVGSSPIEYGAPAQGDNGDGTVGTPNVLDDNRGSYKIISVDDANTLTVEFYAGDSGTARTSYKLLPSVNGSDSQLLRQTAGVDGNTYTTTTESIHPFSYRILRRNPTLNDSLAGSFLFFRERTLSWVEVIKSFNQLPTQPYTWGQYEDEGLIDEVGLEDKSHPSNDILLQNILGNEADKPFINNETCLSVYDRRMIIEDPKMTSEGYGVPEDGISTTLENDISSMNARDNRYAWISIRTDQIEGTLAKLSRVSLDNPNETALEDINNE